MVSNHSSLCSGPRPSCSRICRLDEFEHEKSAVQLSGLNKADYQLTRHSTRTGPSVRARRRRPITPKGAGLFRLRETAALMRVSLTTEGASDPRPLSGHVSTKRPSSCGLRHDTDPGLLGPESMSWTTSSADSSSLCSHMKSLILYLFLIFLIISEPNFKNNLKHL